MIGKRSTGQAVKTDAIRRATEKVSADVRDVDNLDLYRSEMARAERLETIVRHPHFGEVEALLLEDVFALSYAKDENLLVRASAARGSLRTLDRIYEAIKRGEQAVAYLAEIEETAKKEKSDAENRGRTSNRTGSRKETRRRT